MSPNGKTVLISGGLVYDDDGDTDHPFRADISIVGDTITSVDRCRPGALVDVRANRADVIIDASDRLVLPGLVNAHYHSHDALLKGCFETIPRETWLLNALPPNYRPRSLAELRARTLLGAVECLRAGITTVQDMATLSPIDPESIEVILAAYAEAGIRCVFSLQVGDVHGARVTPFWEEVLPKAVHGDLSGVVTSSEDADSLVAKLAAFHRRFEGDSDTLTWGLAPSSPERSTPAFLRAIARLSDERDLPVFTHVYESRATTLIARQKFGEWGGSLVSYLEAHGLLGPRTSLAHGVWMLPAEIEAIARAGTSVVLNPVGNLKTRSGIAPISQYLEAGVNVGLGCDNNSCSDAQNLFQVMKAFAGLPAVSNVVAPRPTARDAMFAATAGGARAIGLACQVGRIRPGFKADLTLLDLSDFAFVPFNSAARQVVFSECGRSVDTVLVNGRIVVSGGKIMTVNEASLRHEIEGLMQELRPEISTVQARTEELRPHLSEALRRTWEAPLEVNRYATN
jgi:5-methylthioadenosine/S-adenosylhomocysteine deaminase